ncbi:MAG: phosphocholine cytidylyltransferase family protein [Treponema sp.]|nr:phosphocholine cytidylyltransferase family protein [Treponema sp.]
MKALFLAAGRGTRISRYLEGKPKCTVPVNGTPLIQYSVNLLKENGIHDIGIVTGYRSEVIVSLLKDRGVSFFYNPFFDVTNSIASAWFARDFLSATDDLIIMNADVFIEQSILTILKTETLSPLMLSDENRKKEADYKLKYTDGILEKYGKDLTGTDITGEYVGIAKLSKDFIPTFTSRLEDMIHAQQHGLWWENVLYSLSDMQDIYVKNIAGNFWAEVDYIEDYERIKHFTEGKLV